jgi:hypothetical protein
MIYCELPRVILSYHESLQFTWVTMSYCKLP